MAKDAFYFTHDSNANADPKCMRLISQLGMEGYGIYWMLVETLRDQPDFKYPLDLTTALADRFKTSSEKIKAVITIYGLFENDEKSFWSASLNRRMEKVNILRQNAIKAGKASANKRLPLASKTTPVQQSFNGRSTDVEQGFNLKKESKVKEIKEKNKEESKEETAAAGAVFIAFENNITMLTPMIAEELKDLQKQYPEAWILDAIKESVGHNGRSLSYMKAILTRWQTQGRNSEKKSNEIVRKYKFD